MYLTDYCLDVYSDSSTPVSPQGCTGLGSSFVFIVNEMTETLLHRTHRPLYNERTNNIVSWNHNCHSNVAVTMATPIQKPIELYAGSVVRYRWTSG